jgi:hypothetical protein
MEIIFRTIRQTAFKKVWGTTLRKAGIRYFRLYELRHASLQVARPTKG